PIHGGGGVAPSGGIACPFRRGVAWGLHVGTTACSCSAIAHTQPLAMTVCHIGVPAHLQGSSLARAVISDLRRPAAYEPVSDTDPRSGDGLFAASYGAHRNGLEPRRRPRSP